MALTDVYSGRRYNWKAALQGLLVLFLFGCFVPVCVFCDEFDDNGTATQAQSDSGYCYEGLAYVENMAFLHDSAYVSEWFALSERLGRLTSDSLDLFDEIMWLYVKDLHHMGFDAYLNLQQLVFRHPDTMGFMINYGSACRAYERTHQIAPLISDPFLQMLTHDLRHALRVLALKIEKLMFGRVPPGQDEPTMLLWMHGTGSSNDSAASQDR